MTNQQYITAIMIFVLLLGAFILALIYPPTKPISPTPLAKMELREPVQYIATPASIPLATMGLREPVQYMGTVYTKKIPVQIQPASIKLLTKPQWEFLTDLCKDSHWTPEILYAIMCIESKCDLNAISPTHDLGIMQIHYSQFDYYFKVNKDVYVKWETDTHNVFDYKTNVITGYLNLQYWHDKFPNASTTDLLCHYNQGWKIINPNYGKKVMDFVNTL